MTTWTQSDLWSREWPNRRLPVSGGSHAKYVLVRSYSRISKSAWNSVCQRCRRKLNSSCLCASSLSRHRYRLSLPATAKSSPSRVPDGALRVPLPMQPPLAAWVDQPVGHQRLQHVQPTRSLSRGRQSWRPEVIQPQLIPQMAGQPAGAPLPRPVQPQSAEPDMHHIAIQNWRRAVLGEQRDLPRVLASLVERFDRSAPRGFLAVIDLAQIQHLPLHRPPARHPAVLDDAPVAVLLAVLLANLVAQKHAARFCSRRSSRKLLGRHRCRFSTVLPRSHQADQPVAVQPIRKIPQIRVELRKSG